MVTAVGTPLNDVFFNTNPTENDDFNGLAGYDVVSRYNTGFKSGAFALTAEAGVVTYTAGTEVDIYRSIEQVDFIDGRMVFDQGDAIAQVVRLYDAAFNRAPDQGGLNFFSASLYRGLELSQAADGFINSQEFVQRYGADLSNQGFVEQLYRNVLDREGDADGIANWTNALNSGVSRTDVLVGFSESPEHQAILAPIVAAGIWDRSDYAALVARLYDSVFDRLPDFGGLYNWTSLLNNGSLTTDAVAESFLSSAEAQLVYGPELTNLELVNALYVNALGREGDAAGVQNWVSALDAGALTRAQVLLGFSESTEHQLQTAADVGGETPDSYGIAFA